MRPEGVLTLTRALVQVGNLAFSDLCLGLVVLPLSSVYAITGEWLFPETLCVVFVSGECSSAPAHLLSSAARQIAPFLLLHSLAPLFTRETLKI